MKNDAQVSFEKRWQAAIRAPEVIVAKVQKREFDISIETIVERYSVMLDAAVAEHVLDKLVHDEVVQSLVQLKQTVKKIDPKKIKPMKFRLPSL